MPMIDYSDIIDSYAATQSLRKTSAECGVSIQIARRVLASAGVYTSDLTETINRMHSGGKSVEEIALHLGIRPKSVLAHLPYTRTSYVIGEKTKNARNISKWRARQKDIDTSPEI